MFLLILKIILIYFIIKCYNFDVTKILPIVLPISLAVAFFTTFERKILASMQRRRGPNVVGLYGLLQAIADASKLINKESLVPSSSNMYISLLSPLFTFLISMLCWALIPFNFNSVIADINLGLSFTSAFSSLGVYGITLSGWSSNSKYSFSGALRSSAQFISYEISLGLILVPIILLSCSLNLSEIVLSQKHIFYCIPLLPLSITSTTIVLAETNRIPFDSPEAESELVPGHNVEYSSIGFTFLSLAEYSNIILMSSVIVIIFLGGWWSILFFSSLNGGLISAFKLLIVMFLIVWVRATLPRYRYDQLMFLGWKVILPLSLGFTISYIFISNISI